MCVYSYIIRIFYFLTKKIMQKTYTPEIFEQDKAKFIFEFPQLYYSSQEYNSSLDLVCRFNRAKKEFEIFGISQNSKIPENYFMIFRVKEGIKMDEDYSFEDLDREIYEVLKTLDKRKISAYITNHYNNLNEVKEIDDKTLNKLILDIEEISKEEYEIDEFISSLMASNYFFCNYLVNNLYKGYYLEGKLYEDYYTNLFINEIEKLKYDDVFDINLFD